MTEEVLVSVRGFHQTDQPEGDEVELVSPGKYYFRNGKHYVLYEEAIDDSGIMVKNRVILKDGYMEVQKKGPFQTTMTFDRGQKTMNLYQTPFGQLNAGIDVKQMYFHEEENLIDVIIDYELELNYEHAADSRIQVRIMAKNSGLFKLR